MKANKIVNIQYTKATAIGGELGKVTERTIIPTFVPHPNIKALDVSDLSESKQHELQKLLEEYSKFYKERVKNIPSLDTWAEQSQGLLLGESVKWRTFKQSNIEVLD